MSAPLAIDVVAAPSRAHALLQPARIAMLEELLEPRTAVELARRLDLPRQRVHYHLRELEREGLVECVEERRRGSTLRRLLRRSARSYAISGAALGRLACDPRAVEDRRSSAFLVALAARTIAELGTLDAGARTAGMELATLALDVELRFATPARRAAFAEDLAQAVAALVLEYHDERAQGGRTFRLVASAYPRPGAPAGDAATGSGPARPSKS